MNAFESLLGCNFRRQAFLHGINRPSESIVAVIYRLNVIAVTESVECDQSLYLAKKKLARLVDVIPACRNTVDSSEAHKVVEKSVVPRNHTFQLIKGLDSFQHRTVFFHELEREFLQKPAVHRIDIIRCESRRVLSHKEVGHYAPSAVNSAAADGLELLCLVELYAVRIIKLAMIVSAPRL